jgi:hypothetical protein
MPVKGFASLSLKREALERLNRYAEKNGVKTPQLLYEVAKRLEDDVDLYTLIKAIEQARLIRLQEAAKAEYVRDLLVKAYLSIQNAKVEIQSLLAFTSEALNHAPALQDLLDSVSILGYEERRLQKILDEAYPKGWLQPLPPISAARSFSFIRPPTPSDDFIKILKEKAVIAQDFDDWLLRNYVRAFKHTACEFLQHILGEINGIHELLTKLDPYLPEIYESIEESLKKVEAQINKVIVEKLSE